MEETSRPGLCVEETSRPGLCVEETSRPGLSVAHSRLHVCCQVLLVECPHQHHRSAKVWNAVDVCSVGMSRHHSLLCTIGFLKVF